MGAHTTSANTNVPTSTPSTGDMQMILGNSKPERSQLDDLSSPRGVIDVRPVPMSSETRTIPQSTLQVDSKPTTIAAVIGAKIRFIGELVGEEDLLIQGYVEGTIDLRGNSLTVGKHGVVKANVLAKNVTIEGKIEGDVFGEERISVKSSSQVRGNLVAERVTLEEGAKFKGSIDMDMESRKEEFKSFNQKSALRPFTQTEKTIERAAENTIEK
jgi:cytoskeletal protein CcmA (bactofilin family)